MGKRRTVKVQADADFSTDFIRIPEEEYDPEVHDLYEDEEPPEDPEPEVTYTLAGNGFWTVYVDGEDEASGRGKEDLDIALAEWEESRESATRIDG